MFKKIGRYLKQNFIPIFMLVFVWILVGFQPDSTVVVTPGSFETPSLIYLLVVVVAIVLHWIKKFFEGYKVTLWQWIALDFGKTIVSVLTTFAQIGVYYAANKSALAPVTINGIYIVFLMAYASDSLLNTISNKKVTIINGSTKVDS